MTLDRRTFLGRSGAVGLTVLAWTAGLIAPRNVGAAQIEEAFAAGTPERLIELLAGGVEILPGERIDLQVPDVAENGAIVPITIMSDLENVESIAVIAEKNPVPLIGRFVFGNGADAFVQARIKMAESSHVIVLVSAGGRLFSTRKFVQVTVGGCGT